MRAVPAATVSRPPHTAASRTPTPMGRFHSHANKWTVAEAVFCRMNTSSRIRITNPAINADHSAAARVNFTADSGVPGFDDGDVVAGGPEGAGAGTGSIGRSADADGSLVIAPSLPFRTSNETIAALTVSQSAATCRCCRYGRHRQVTPKGRSHEPRATNPAPSESCDPGDRAHAGNRSVRQLQPTRRRIR